MNEINQRSLWKEENACPATWGYPDKFAASSYFSREASYVDFYVNAPHF
jgi:uncharacterized protein YbdZ (MbtH family)